MAKIIHTDNFGGDYPAEVQVTGLPLSMPENDLQMICAIINARVGSQHPRYWKVVQDDYVLQPGFKP
jgi:hypothetical protein